jgi:hypothetical protein
MSQFKSLNKEYKFKEHALIEIFTFIKMLYFDLEDFDAIVLYAHGVLQFYLKL